MAQSRLLRMEIRRVSHGLCSALVDFLLLELFFEIEFLDAGRSTRRMMRAGDRALDCLERCNASTIHRAFRHLFRRGFIETIRGASERYRITRAGRRWLNERIPTYHEDRPWDGRMHLITYDLPEKQRKARNALRVFLRELRCAPFQASVWLTPYNPRSFLREYVRTNRIPGVVVSEFGKGSVIGEGTFRDVVEHAYRLRVLNDRYEQFLQGWRARSDARPADIATAYTSILGDDPQLPFELLPPYWLGDRAHAFTRKVFRRAARSR